MMYICFSQIQKAMIKKMYVFRLTRNKKEIRLQLARLN